MTSDKALKQAISNMTIWRKGEQRAPHKPLLLLHILSRYRQGHDRLFSYDSEIYEPLLDLLERYGLSVPGHAVLASEGRWLLGTTKRGTLLNPFWPYYYFLITCS